MSGRLLSSRRYDCVGCPCGVLIDVPKRAWYGYEIESFINGDRSPRRCYSMNRSVPSSNNGSSNLPRLSKSRLPVSSQSTGVSATTRLAKPHPTARLLDASPRLAASSSTPRLQKSPAPRPRTISTDPKPLPSSAARAPPLERPRTKSATKIPNQFHVDIPEQTTPSKVPAMSMKEAIALKRAEAKKAMAAQKAFAACGGPSASGGMEDASQNAWAYTVEGDGLGRLSIRETIERARSSGVYQWDLSPTHHFADSSRFTARSQLKVRSTLRHATFRVSLLPYSRFTSQ
jgi:hypothetical protein